METNQCNPAGEQYTPAYEKPSIEIIKMEMEGILCTLERLYVYESESGRY
ncbi:hypothetical protein SAMN05216357_12249 [Porphyromonadaceae bacterium KH3CP3RA]|nr:hypothetical protein SAMN05216357_12249 [Porphyromonadaceae bacterium KH3CP3RA]